MSASTEPSASTGLDATAPSSGPATQQKPRFALFIATAGGLGYLPKAPGTWGSLGGVLLVLLPWWAPLLVTVPRHELWNLVSGENAGFSVFFYPNRYADPLLLLQLSLGIIIGAIGVWSAGRVARFWNVKDPGRVVIDEVSGQHLTLLIGCAPPLLHQSSGAPWIRVPLGLVTLHSALNWKYLLVGFILFRVFDIWKPFPARQAEALPGGWGIMADDWVAGIYAGIGLWVARAAGL